MPYMPRPSQSSQPARPAQPERPSEPCLAQLQDALRRHDWYYNYSDDHSAWRRGRDHAQLIARLRAEAAAAGFAAQADALFNFYAK